MYNSTMTFILQDVDGSCGEEGICSSLYKGAESYSQFVSLSQSNETAIPMVSLTRFALEQSTPFLIYCITVCSFFLLGMIYPLFSCFKMIYVLTHHCFVYHVACHSLAFIVISTTDKK